MSTEELPQGAEISEELTNERDVREHFLNRSHALGLYLVEGQERYPDLHMRDVETGEDVFVEVEHLSANFIDHGHHEQEVENEADFILCGADNLSRGDASKVPPVKSLEDLFSANVSHTPTYRIAAYESTSTRRKSIALRVNDNGIAARMEDEDREEGSSPGGWKNDSPTWWMPVKDFTALFKELSNRELAGDTIGERVFGGERVNYDPLIELGRQDSRLSSEGDRSVLATHTYTRSNGKTATAKAILRVNSSERAPNFRIQHFIDGDHKTPRTAIYSHDEFVGVFNKLSQDARRGAFIKGDPEPLADSVERQHGVSLYTMAE